MIEYMKPEKLELLVFSNFQIHHLKNWKWKAYLQPMLTKLNLILEFPQNELHGTMMKEMESYEHGDLRTRKIQSY